MSVEKLLPEEKQGEALKTVSKNSNNSKKLYLESYGCAMNFSDSEIIASILDKEGFNTTQDFKVADLIFLNTCAIRDNAEQRVRNRLNDFKQLKRKNPSLIIGVLGCMAERLKSKLLEEEKLVDLVVGPDSYRDLPNLIETVEGGQKAVNVLLSREETYADISPVRLDSNGITAFVSITRGCDNMCAFCVVPFTRGRERSREPETIVNEARDLFERGYKEVTLLGQNVNSYLWTGGGLKKDNPSEDELKNATTFAQLLEKVALINPDLRIRYSTSHPKDMGDDVLEIMAKYENICNYVHLPVQSGSSRVLEMMNRGYTREWYMDRINAIKRFMPDAGISTDTISGFCGETEEDHKETMSLMEWSGFDFSYMFKYSERPKTLAERKFKDDVDEATKSRRLAEIIEVQKQLSHKSNIRDLGKEFKVLIEGVSKKSADFLYGRNSQNKVIVFPKKDLKKGDYAIIKVTSCTPATLLGEAVQS
ncbi:MAG: tRNA (N6-isopentenyl adenosine(37)-C2)-methylthiotransferase MiaB [Bacteroidota bacterium]|jgi:tRNA-2-methylthio-N6-dimethylallyladenosine synthase